MANHKSSKKRARQAIVRNERNTSRRTAVKTAVKNVRNAIEAGKKEEASTLLVTAQKLLGRLAKHGVIKTNTAGRKTSRLANQINKL
ncbi:30S ribosomal protein S20 [Halobacteriovorax sp.]|uniref:30S ribosomal protein S20 n=1 Tax=Halobacteriovorax sp. TaxID=2020862 RepID=UPI003AF1E89F